MDLQLKGKTALVTGSTAGIGFAIAERLAAEGAKVYVNGRTEERVRSAVARIQGAAEGRAFDLSRAEDCERIIGSIPHLDILVNNLGIYEPKPFEEVPDADWLRFVETNFLSGVRLSRHWLPRMKRAGWGRILFISSESAVHIPAEMIHYGVTKTMQVALARGLAETTVGTGVTVNSVLPGPTRSEAVAGFLKTLSADKKVDESELEQWFFREVRPSSLLKRFESPEEIAAMTAFLASPLSSGTNGAAIRVDGGLLRSIL